MEFLGHQVGGDIITPNSDNLEKVGGIYLKLFMLSHNNTFIIKNNRNGKTSPISNVSHIQHYLGLTHI